MIIVTLEKTSCMFHTLDTSVCVFPGAPVEVALRAAMVTVPNYIHLANRVLFSSVILISVHLTTFLRVFQQQVTQKM